MTEQPLSSQPKRTMDEVLYAALTAVDDLELEGERASVVKLATKALLVVRGALHPELFRKRQGSDKIFNPYPIIAKYIRASNAETLGGLVDDALRNISPEFITLQSAGTAIPSLFSGGEIEQAAVSLLKEETIPIVMLMKTVYQRARGFDEADQLLSEEQIVPEEATT